MARYPHIEKRMRTTVLTVASSPYTVLVADEYVACDATGGAITVNLPALSTVPGLTFVFAKTDSSGNTVTLDGNGGETINGQTTFQLLGQYDSVMIIATPAGWLIVNFTPGTLIVPNDTVEFQILDRSAADILNVATLALAEVNAAAQASRFSLVNYGRYVVSIDVSAAGLATELYIASRTSGMSNPDVTLTGDWSYYGIDNINTTTGESDSPPYVMVIPIDGARRYTRSFLTWGSWSAPIIWCNGNNCRGIIYAQRFSGG